MKTIYSPEYRRLVDSVRAQRRKLKLRQEDVAQRLGVSRNWISKVEIHEKRLDVLEYVELCRALELDPAEGLRLLKERER